MAKIPVVPVGGESGGFVFGQYTGNNQPVRKIHLGFRAKAVFVFEEGGPSVSGRTGLALDGYPCCVYNGKPIIRIEDDGFNVYLEESGGSSNYGGPSAPYTVKYNYIAFR